MITKKFKLMSATLLFLVYHPFPLLFFCCCFSFLYSVPLIKFYTFSLLMLCLFKAFIFFLVVALHILPCTINCMFFLTVIQYCSFSIDYKKRSLPTEYYQTLPSSCCYYCLEFEFNLSQSFTVIR